MYLGCTIQHEDDQFAELIGVVNVDAHFIHEETGSYGFKDVRFSGKLLLTPLSEITDEHAVEVAKVLNWLGKEQIEQRIEEPGLKEQCISFGKKIVHKLTIRNEVVIQQHNLIYCYQYLASIGYAVPLFFGIEHWANGKTPIDLGIAISKNEVK